MRMRFDNTASAALAWPKQPREFAGEVICCKCLRMEARSDPRSGFLIPGSILAGEHIEEFGIATRPTAIFRRAVPGTGRMRYALEGLRVFRDQRAVRQAIAFQATAINSINEVPTSA